MAVKPLYTYNKRLYLRNSYWGGRPRIISHFSLKSLLIPNLPEPIPPESFLCREKSFQCRLTFDKLRRTMFFLDGKLLSGPYLALNRGINRYIQINGWRYTGGSVQMIIMFLNMAQRLMYSDSCCEKMLWWWCWR